MVRGAGSRIAAVTSLVLAVVVVALVLVRGGEGSYSVVARFADAGQLVRGNLVEVAGRRVGTIDELRLAPDGSAEAVLSIEDERVTPLREGTRAQIRTVGLASVANRIVDLAPGPPGAPELPDGAVLSQAHTRGVVDLDVVLNTLDAGVREDLQTVLREGAHVLAQPTPERLNRALEHLHPAVAQTARLTEEVVAEREDVEQLVDTAARVSRALASRREDLAGGVEAAASALEQVASRRDELGALLDRVPQTLRATESTLARLGETLPRLDPMLREARPAVGPLGAVLRRTPPLARDARPAIAQLRELLPQARAVLDEIPEVDRKARPAIDSATPALRELLPIVAGLRAYGPDFVGGLFNGFGGAAGGFYDANGHFIRISLQGAPSSLPGLVPTPGFSFPGNGYRTGLTARCPGAAAEPHPDGSNPWRPDPSLCNPAHDHRP
jgi:phospholipid/cholesterol/gamma-HCH transport system substrate-binding protein